MVNCQRLDHPAEIRMVESWLPLAQEANALYGWGYDAGTLEQLIITAATDLLQARTAWEARVVLWQTYQLQQEAA